MLAPCLPATLAICVCHFVAGCANWGGGFSFGTSTASRAPIPQGSTYSVNLSASSDSPALTGLVAGILLFEGMRYYLRQADGRLIPLQRVPELEPDRRISEQDCSGVVVLDGGNLRCR